MKYQFLLDGSDVTSRVEFGANVKERFAEELDVGGIALSYWDTGDAIKVLSRVDIRELQDDGETIIKEYNMLVMQDRVEAITKQVPVKYRHELSLVELTHKLDYFIINALGFTQPIEDLKKAPFEHYYTQSYDNFDSEGEGVGEEVPFSLEFPQIDGIYNKYISNTVTIKQLPEAILWHVPDGINSLGDIEEFKFYDLIANLYSYEVEYNNERIPTLKNETLIDGNNNTNLGDVTFTNLNDGLYYLDIGVFDKNFSIYNSFGHLERYSRYYFEIDTRGRYTLYDVLKRIRDVSPIEKRSIHEETRLFDISEDLENKLKLIEAPQLYMNRLTTREAINDALKYVNAISRLIRNENDILSADFFNERQGNNTFSLAEVFEISSFQTTKDYVSNNRAFLSNAINSNAIDNPSVVELGNNLYKGIRSEQFQVLPETGVLKLQYNIYRLLSVKAKISYNLEYNFLAGTPEQVLPDIEENIQFDLELLPFILENNLLSIQRKINDTFGDSGVIDELNRLFSRDRDIEVASYNFATNTINLGGVVGSYYIKTKLNRMIESAIAEELAHRQGKAFRDQAGNIVRENGIFRRNSVNPEKIRAFNGDEMIFANNDYVLQVPFNVTYIAMEDNIIDSHKEDTTIIDKYTEQPTNVNAPIVNFERAAISNYGLAQRLGVPAIRYGKITKELETEEVGNVNQNNEVVVEKESIYYPDHKVQVFSASRDFNRLSQFISVDRAYRPFENPLSRFTLNRNDIYNEYIEYSTSSTMREPDTNDTYINNFAMETILNTFLQDENKYNDFVKLVLMRTDGFIKENPDKIAVTAFDENTRNALIVPVISQGGKNALSFKFGFKNNISAGDAIRENKNGIDFEEGFFKDLIDKIGGLLSGGEVTATAYGWWREFVPYGDNNGFFDYLHFKMLTDFNVPSGYGLGNDGFYEETKKLPLIQSNSPNENAYFPAQTDTTVFETGNPFTFDDSLYIRKDTSEIFSLTYQISFTPKTNNDNESIVLGKTFSSQNLLVYPFKNKEMRLHLYDDINDTYSKFDDRDVKPGVSNVLANIDIIEFANIPYGIEIKNDLQNYTHWALADAEGNLYLANNTPNPYVFFEPRNKRSTINYNW